MKQLINLISKYFSLVLICFLAFGLIFQDISAIISPYVKYPLLGVMYFSFLKIDLTILKKELKRIDLQLGILVFTNLILPVLLYSITIFMMHLLSFNIHWSYGVLLLYASPTGALCPALCILLKGNPERATINLILTTITVPFTLPLLVKFFIPISNNFNLNNLILDLLIIVFIPLVAAFLSRIFFKSFTNKVAPHLAPISIFLIGTVVIGAVSGITSVIIKEPSVAIKGLILSSIAITLAFIIGWFFSFGGSHNDRFTLSIFSSWPNIGLTIVIASEYFKKEFMIAWVFVVLSEITWNIAFMPAQKWSNYLIKRNLKDENGDKKENVY